MQVMENVGTAAVEVELLFEAAEQDSCNALGQLLRGNDAWRNCAGVPPR